MNDNTRVRELELEQAIASHLEDRHGVRVHVDGDALNRRRAGYVTLRFDYGPCDGSRTKVRMSVVGDPRQSRTFSVDLGDPEAIEDVAPLCGDFVPRIGGDPDDLASRTARRREDD
jgi:hypothetical protein